MVIHGENETFVPIIAAFLQGPVRNPAEKWFVPVDDYPEEFYPPYFAGK